MTTEEMPNPQKEGFRTAHEQNTDGSYKITVVPEDLVAGKCPDQDSSRRIDERAPAVQRTTNESESNAPALTHVLVGGSGRRIARKMEQAYRLRHHDFGGKSEDETMAIMGIEREALRKLLWRLKKIAPQLFPVLTPRQARAWHLWHSEGMSHSMIADVMGTSVNGSWQLIRAAKRKFKYNDVLNQRLKVMDPKQLEMFEIGRQIVKIF